MASTTHDDRLIPNPDHRAEGRGFDEEGQGGAPRRRRGLAGFFVVLGALAIAAGAWYVTQKLARTGGETTGELPLLIAETEPVKVKPEDPGGVEIPNRGTYVYKSLESEPVEQPVEQLLPAPEEPLPRPVETGPRLEPIGNIALDDMWSSASAARTSVDDAAQAAPAIIEDAPSALEPEAGEAPGDESFTPPAPAETLVEALEGLKLEPEVVQAPKAVPEAGGVWLQVASLQDEATVEPEWSRLVRRYSGALGAVQHRVLPADLGAKGLWYRLQAGPFADAASAEEACRSIKTAGGSCQVLKP